MQNTRVKILNFKSYHICIVQAWTRYVISGMYMHNFMLILFADFMFCFYLPKLQVKDKLFISPTK